jgi:hypothetical protein
MKNHLLFITCLILLNSCKDKPKAETFNKDVVSTLNSKKETINLEAYGDPSTISFFAERAIVTSDSSVQRVTLINISPLATMTSSVHIHNKRVFRAFPISELPESWNTCNAMKFEHGLFHSDGLNSVMTFGAGPSGHIEHGHLSTPPLITQRLKVEKTEGSEEGTLYTMLLNAKGDSKTMSFDLEGTVLTDGEYFQVLVSTECTSWVGSGQ